MKKQIVLISLIFIWIINNVFAGGSREKEYVFATDSTWPPMEFINEERELVGFDIDLAKAIAKEENFKMRFISTGWDGIFAGLQNGEYDAIFSAVTITKKRKETMFFSDPYFNAGQLLAIRKQDMATINGLDDLSGKIVGVQIGTSGAFFVEESYANVILKTYDDLGPAVEELAQGTIDGIVADIPLIVDYLLNNQKYKDRFITVGEPMTNEEYGVAMKKGNTKLRDIINSGLKKIKSNGIYDKIYSKWIK